LQNLTSNKSNKEHTTLARHLRIQIRINAKPNKRKSKSEKSLFLISKIKIRKKLKLKSEKSCIKKTKIKIRKKLKLKSEKSLSIEKQQN
jgi:hypothetical protein